MPNMLLKEFSLFILLFHGGMSVIPLKHIMKTEKKIKHEKSVSEQSLNLNETGIKFIKQQNIYGKPCIVRTLYYSWQKNLKTQMCERYHKFMDQKDQYC